MVSQHDRHFLTTGIMQRGRMASDTRGMAQQYASWAYGLAETLLIYNILVSSHHSFSAITKHSNLTDAQGYVLISGDNYENC